MTLLRRLAVLGLFLILAIPQGWAQISSPIGIFTGSGTLSVYGWNVSISNCSFAHDASSAPVANTGCSSGDGVKLQGVQSGRDTISLKVMPTSGSAALSQAMDGKGTYLTFTVSVTPGSSAYGTPKASGALLQAIGVDTYNNGSTGCNSGVNCGVTFTTTASNGTSTLSTSPLTTSSPFTNNSGTITHTSAVDPTTSFLNTFTFVENMSIVTTGSSVGNQAATTLQLNSMQLKFYTTPEPASITALLVGLSGLVMVRRRRRAS